MKPINSLSLYLAPCSENFSVANGDYQVRYIVLGNDVMFSVSARTTGWVGIGISDDMLMVSFVITIIVPWSIPCLPIVFQYLWLPKHTYYESGIETSHTYV